MYIPFIRNVYTFCADPLDRYERTVRLANPLYRMSQKEALLAGNETSCGDRAINRILQ